MADEIIAAVDNLTLTLVNRHGRRTELLSGVSLSVKRGEIVALVGESGCGKSLTCLSLAKLNPEPPFQYSGRIRILDRDVLTLPPRELRRLRGGTVAYIFQDPGSSLNPVLRVGTQVAEALHLHQPDLPDPDGRVVELLRQVGIPDPELRAKAYPHQLSGGMQQRIMIAMALSCRPPLLVADEPTTALDVTIQAQILELFLQLRRDLNMAVLLVTHNLGIVAGVADTVAVMYAGQVVERASVAELFRHPAHPYTKALLEAVPRLSQVREQLPTIPGRVPSPADYTPGCRFAGRCSRARPECFQCLPPPAELAPEHWVWCYQ